MDHHAGDQHEARHGVRRGRRRAAGELQTQEQVRQTVMFKSTMPPAVEAGQELLPGACGGPRHRGQARRGQSRWCTFAREQEEQALLSILNAGIDPPIIIRQQEEGSRRWLKVLEKMGYNVATLRRKGPGAEGARPPASRRALRTSRGRGRQRLTRTSVVNYDRLGPLTPPTELASHVRASQGRRSRS